MYWINRKYDESDRSGIPIFTIMRAPVPNTNTSYDGQKLDAIDFAQLNFVPTAIACDSSNGFEFVLLSLRNAHSLPICSNIYIGGFKRPSAGRSNNAKRTKRESTIRLDESLGRIMIARK